MLDPQFAFAPASISEAQNAFVTATKKNQRKKCTACSYSALFLEWARFLRHIICTYVPHAFEGVVKFKCEKGRN